MAILAMVAMSLITVAVIPSFRTGIKVFFANPSRNVLAKVTGSVGREGPQVTILKIESNGSLSLEIYNNSNEGQVLLSKIPLSEARDGYFLLKGNATNLAITDVDSDGNLEVVAPTYDDQMVPRLNIFRYNPMTSSFDRVNAP